MDFGKDADMLMSGIQAMKLKRSFKNILGTIFLLTISSAGFVNCSGANSGVKDSNGISSGSGNTPETPPTNNNPKLHIYSTSGSVIPNFGSRVAANSICQTSYTQWSAPQTCSNFTALVIFSDENNLLNMATLQGVPLDREVTVLDNSFLAGNNFSELMSSPPTFSGTGYGYDGASFGTFQGRFGILSGYIWTGYNNSGNVEANCNNWTSNSNDNTRIGLINVPYSAANNHWGSTVSGCDNIQSHMMCLCWN
jgi:hypothetical protein